MKRNKRTECWTCRHRRDIPGNCHIGCGNPDPEMIGDQQGIDGGWFFYPVNFDPTWKLKECRHYSPVDKPVDNQEG